MAYEYEVDDETPYVVIEKQSGSVGSFLIGAAMGAAVALLFAPQSGTETRRSIKRRARRVGEAAQGVVEDATERVSDTFHEARRKVEERIDSARHAVELKKRQVTRAMDAGREAAQQARDELERRIAETKAAYEAGADVARDAREARVTRRAASVRPGAPAATSRPLESAADAALGDTSGADLPGLPDE